MHRVPDRDMNPPEPKIEYYCYECGGEIFKGEEYYELEGNSIHVECSDDYLKSCISIAGS